MDSYNLFIEAMWIERQTMTRLRNESSRWRPPLAK